MININLLPDVLRKKERMPMPHLLALVGVVCLLGGLGYAVMQYKMNIIPGLTARRDSLRRERTALQAKEKELKDINAQIATLSQHVDAVKTLYRNRVVWSKILSDVKNIVNFDPAMSEYNADMRYLWLTRFVGKGKNLALDGFATASTQVVAMQMPERLLQGFLNYTPATLPEKDEEVRLQEELRVAMANYDALRRENPELPVQGPEETALRQRLEELKKVKSGGIALRPFVEILNPGSLKLLSATWTRAPQSRRTGAAAVSYSEIFPAMAWSFKVSMDFK